MISKFLPILVSTLSILQYAASANHPLNKNEFVVTVSMKGLQKGIACYLIDQNMNSDTISRTISNNESIQFKDTVDKGGRLVKIAFEPKSSYFQTESFYLTANSIHIEGTIDVTSRDPFIPVLKYIDIYVTGAPGNIAYLDFNKKIIPTYAAYQKLKNKLTELETTSTDSIEVKSEAAKLIKEILPLEKSHQSAIKSWIIKNQSSIIIPYLLLNISTNGSDKEFVLKTFKKMSPVQRESYYGKKIIKTLNNASIYLNIKKGAKFPSFVMLDTTGNKIDFFNTLQKHKVILIDFWASWCIPCRNAVPQLKSIYEDLKSQGFTIMSITVDKNEDVNKWKKAVSEDNTPWYQFTTSDSEELRNQLGLTSIPKYAVLDSSGNFIAFGGTSLVPSFGNSLSLSHLKNTLIDILNSQK